MSHGAAYGVAYLITNTVNGKRYVGITKRKPEARWAAHRRRANTRLGSAIHRAMSRHGAERFDFQVIASARSAEDLCAIERVLIAQWSTYWTDGSGYNLTKGGEGPFGLVHTPETKAKMSATRKGRPHSPEHSAAISKALTGQSLSLEHRARMSADRKGRGVGRPMAEGARLAFTAYNAARAETALANRKPTVVRYSQEWKDKIGAAKRARDAERMAKAPPPTLQATYGSQEHRDNIRAGRLAGIAKRASMRAAAGSGVSD